MSERTAVRWRMDEIASLKSATGKDALRVAAMLWRSPTAVQYKARKIGVPVPRMPHGRYWNQETKRRALELRSSGKSVSDISACTGVPFGTIRRWVYAAQPNQPKNIRMNTEMIEATDIRPALNTLTAILCSPDGDICIPGSPDDKRLVREALTTLEQAAPQLWCLHILGPDDVHPAPSKRHAEIAAEGFNKAFGELSAENEVMCKAVAAPWPHDPASHAESVQEFIKDWMIPALATPEPAGYQVCAYNDSRSSWGGWRDASKAEFESVANSPSWKTRALFTWDCLAKMAQLGVDER